MPSQEQPFTTVDAFTEVPFGGNPAAVIVWDDPVLAADDQLAQQIAAEFNLSETAFARRLEGRSEEEPRYELRWRTPMTEVPLCGHATLATAHTLFTSRHPQANLLTFVTRHSGELIARRTASPAQATSSPLNAADPGPISLDFPAASLVTLESGHRRRAKIVDAVLRAVQGLGESAIVRVAWWDGQRSPVVELPAGTDLQNLHVSPTPLGEIGEIVILTCPAPTGSGHDIHSRVFCPALGVPEDPVTGAAHTALAPFWLLDPHSLSRLSDLQARESSAPITLRAKQVSARGGEMELEFDERTRRVQLRGRARRVLRGVIEL